MGVYSEVTRNYTGAFDFDSVEESTHVPGIEGAYAIFTETQENYNAIMKAIGIEELAHLESTGVEMVYEAGDVKGFFAKIKEFFMSILRKIASLVKKFFAMVDSWTKSDKDFVEKYKKALTQVSTKDFEYKGFKFSNLNWSPNQASDKMKGNINSKTGVADFGAMDAKVKAQDVQAFETILSATEDSEDIRDAMRASAIGASGTIESSEFHKEIFKHFRSDEDSKDTIRSVNVTDLLSTISGSLNVKKEAKRVFDALEKVIKEEIKNLDRLESDTLKLIPGKTDADKSLQGVYTKAIGATSKITSLTKDRLSYLQMVNGGLLTAIKDENRQAKSVCVSLLNYKPKNESADFEHYTESTSFLSGVKLK